MRLLFCIALVAFAVGCGKKAPEPAPVPPEPQKGQPQTPEPPGGGAAGKGKEQPKERPKGPEPVSVIRTGFAVRQGSTNGVYLSADGGVAAVFGVDHQKSQVWTVGAEPKRLQEFAGMVTALSPDGARCLRYTANPKGLGRYEIVSTGTGAVLSTLKTNGFQHVAFSSPETVVGLQTAMKSDAPLVPRVPPAVLVQEFSATKGTMTSEFEIPHPVMGRNFAFFDGGKGLAIGVRKDRRVEFWDLAGKKKSREVTLDAPPAKGSEGEGKWFSFSVGRDGTWLAVDACAYNAATGAKATADPFVLPTTGSLVSDRTLYVYSKTRTEGSYPHLNHVSEYVVCDFVKRAEVATLRLPKDSLSYFHALSPDGNVMLTQRDNGELAVWDLAKLR